MGTITRNFANNIVTGGKVDGTDGLTGTIPASNVANDTLGNLTAFPATVGDFVEVTASDVPASPSTAGQLFYNSTSGTLKGIEYTTGTWASGGNLTSDFFGRASSGTQTAGLNFGGRNPGPVFVSGNTEEYNGSSWSEQNNLNTARRYMAGFGTQTSSVACAGAPGGNSPATITEEYNGTSWTSANNMSIGNTNGGGTAGVLTAGFFVGASPPTGSTEEYDGTNWTSGGSLNTARNQSRSFGTLTAGVAAGGEGNPTAVEEYNGTAWTSVTSLPVGRGNNGTGGTQTAGIIMSGQTGSPATPVLTTQEYNGSIWLNGGNTANTRPNAARGPMGTQTDGIIAGGAYPFVGTEEYSGPSGYTAKTLTTS